MKYDFNEKTYPLTRNKDNKYLGTYRGFQIKISPCYVSSGWGQRHGYYYYCADLSIYAHSRDELKKKVNRRLSALSFGAVKFN